MRPASQRFFIQNIYLRLFIISYLATFLGTNSLSVLKCHKAVNQSMFVHLLDSIKITEAAVLKVLRKLNGNKSPGPDCVYPKVLSVGVQMMPLSIIFKQTLEEGSLPLDWKEAKCNPRIQKRNNSRCRKLLSDQPYVSML